MQGYTAGYCISSSLQVRKCDKERSGKVRSGKERSNKHGGICRERGGDRTPLAHIPTLFAQGNFT